MFCYSFFCCRFSPFCFVAFFSWFYILFTIISFYLISFLCSLSFTSFHWSFVTVFIVMFSLILFFISSSECSADARIVVAIIVVFHLSFCLIFRCSFFIHFRRQLLNFHGWKVSVIVIIFSVSAFHCFIFVEKFEAVAYFAVDNYCSFFCVSYLQMFGGCVSEATCRYYY